MARPKKNVRLKDLESSKPYSTLFTAEHLEAAADTFHPIIRERGRGYYNNNRVALESLEPAGVKFQVKGSGSRNYTVFLSGERIDLSTCTCPYPDYCKHIWASLLEAVDLALPLGTTVTRSLVTNNSSENPGRKSWLASVLESSAPRIKDSKKKYRLIFLIGAKGFRTGNPEFYVRPALRYIKQNGKPGAVSEFRENAVLQDVQPQEEMLLKACLHFEGKMLNLYTALGYLQGNHAIQAYTEPSGELKPVRLLRPERMEVDFEPYQQDGKVFFMPLLTLKITGEADLLLTADECLVDFNGSEKILLHSPSGTLALISLSNSRESKILNLLVNSRHLWTPNEIEELTGYLKEDSFQAAEITTDVRLLSTEPEIIIDIIEKRGFLLLHFHFDESGLPGQIKIRHEEGYWELTVINFHGAIDKVRDISTSLGGIIEDYNTLRLDVSINDFLINEVPGLLEKGLKLRLGPNRTNLRRPSDFRIEKKSGIDWLELRVLIDQQEQRVDSLNSGGRLFFTGVEYILLDEEQLEKLTCLEQLPSDTSGAIRLHPNDIGAVQLLGPLADEIDDPRFERSKEIIARLQKGFDYSEKPVSPFLHAELRDYQKEGLEWLRFLKTFGLGGILADDMGLGKTVQSIALLADFLEEGEADGPYLVMAPLSTISNWASEFSRFLPDMNVKVHVGINRGNPGKNPRGVVLTTYQILQRDIDDFVTVKWRLLFIDESQNIKNSTTKTFRATRSLQAEQVLALSGTPIENSVMELWSVMEITNPGLLGPRDRFKRRYLKSSKEGNKKRMAELSQRVSPFILRRTKDVVADDLPPKEEIIRFIELSPAERKYYDRLKNDLRDEVRRIISSGSRNFTAANAVLLALLRLRQAAISPSLLGEEGKLSNASSKIDEVLYLLDTLIAEGHKVLIFSQFVKVLALLRRRLDNNGLEYAYLDGSLSMKARGDAIESFRGGKDIFLISLKAGGTGLNLTEADYVFILDPWWNPAVESQAIDRTHRIGQIRPVIAYKFISSNTVEEKILEMQKSKRRIADDILGFDSSLISRMDPDEILKLFN